MMEATCWSNAVHSVVKMPYQWCYSFIILFSSQHKFEGFASNPPTTTTTTFFLLYRFHSLFATLYILDEAVQIDGSKSSRCGKWLNPELGLKVKIFARSAVAHEGLGDMEWNVSSPTSPLYYSRISQSESWPGGHSPETLRASQSSLALVRSQAEIFTVCWGVGNRRRKNEGWFIRPHLSALLIFFPSLSDLNALHVLSPSHSTCWKSLAICLFLSGFILLSCCLFLCYTAPYFLFLFHSSSLVLPLAIASSFPNLLIFLAVQSVLLLTKHWYLLLPRAH